MYDIIIPSSRPKLAEEAKNSILPYDSTIFDGSGYESFAKLINHCILKSKNETIIIVSDKARAKSEDVDRTLKMIDDGYGLVELGLFAFFGFKKDLVRKIGWLDERFIGGGYEDADYLRRMKESDIGFYYKKEITVIPMMSSWRYCQPNTLKLDLNSISRKHYLNKWLEITDVSFTRMMDEEKYSYDLGEYQHSEFLDFSKTAIFAEAPQSFLTMKMYKK
jgi:hypothetical protein